MAEMVTSDLTPLPESRIIVGCGMVTTDYMAVVDAYPKPDEKIRTRSLQILGGGNSGNALTCTAQLGLLPRLISKVGDDMHGRNIIAELEAAGVDTSHVMISEGGTSTSTYVIVDNETKTRTCVITPGSHPMVPADLSQSSLLSALNAARLVYFDGSSHKTALLVAQEAARMNIPILVECEKNKAGLGGLLDLADYVVCSEKFPQVWTSASSMPSALISILVKLPRAKFVIVTLGENGCMMIERSTIGEDSKTNSVNVETLMESLKLKIDRSIALPTCIASEVCSIYQRDSVSFQESGFEPPATCIASEPAIKLCADGIGTVSGRLLLGTAERIPPSELVDTTGAGDAFIGGVIYGMPSEKMLPFASQVAAANCRALGARTGLPRRNDPRLAPFLL